MKWELFTGLVDKFDLVLPFMLEEEFEEEEILSVIRNWLFVELTCVFGLIYQDEQAFAFNVIYEFLKERYREVLNLEYLNTKIATLEKRVALLDNGDITSSNE